MYKIDIDQRCAEHIKNHIEIKKKKSHVNMAENLEMYKKSIFCRSIIRKNYTLLQYLYYIKI